nr:MAG TPA: hypothetical protein [Caudoviricetes sp.]
MSRAKRCTPIVVSEVVTATERNSKRSERTLCVLI